MVFEISRRNERSVAIPLLEVNRARTRIKVRSTRAIARYRGWIRHLRDKATRPQIKSILEVIQEMLLPREERICAWKVSVYVYKAIDRDRPESEVLCEVSDVIRESRDIDLRMKQTTMTRANKWKQSDSFCQILRQDNRGMTALHLMSWSSRSSPQGYRLSEDAASYHPFCSTRRPRQINSTLRSGKREHDGGRVSHVGDLCLRHGIAGSLRTQLAALRHCERPCATDRVSSGTQGLRPHGSRQPWTDASSSCCDEGKYGCSPAPIQSGHCTARCPR